MPAIELESPFKEVWRKGYLRISKKDGRKRLDLVNNKKDRTTIAYARYLMSVKEGRFLEEWEEVDHKDRDCTNDELSNLQILNVEDHKEKTAKEATGRKMLSCICAYCGIEFERYANRNMYNKTLCSRSCNAKYNRKFSTWTGKDKQRACS